MKFGERKINNDWDYIKCGLDITALIALVLGGFCGIIRLIVYALIKLGLLI